MGGIGKGITLSGIRIFIQTVQGLMQSCAKKDDSSQESIQFTRCYKEVVIRSLNQT